MDRSAYTNDNYDQPHVPPATPPVIDSASDPQDAARLSDVDGDSDAPGSNPAHLDRTKEDSVDFDHGTSRHLMSGGGDTYEPGSQPDEVGPGQGGDNDNPGRTPDEIQPGQGDFDRPDSTPNELPQPVEPQIIPPD